VEETTLHVKNLTRNVRREHLAEIFGRYGRVRRVDVAMDAEVGLPKGCVVGWGHNGVLW
jgi:RNA recognition motif-containing protein